jgi:flagellar export protein FliJ
MKRFTFKLQTALEVRAQKVDHLKAMLGGVQAQWLAKVQQREGMMAELNKASQQRTGTTPLANQIAQDWPQVQQRYGQQIAHCRQQEAQLQHQLAQLQHQLHHAVLDHKVLDTLKTKQQAAHAQAMLKHEEAQLADLMEARFGR